MGYVEGVWLCWDMLGCWVKADQRGIFGDD